jgi:hypothetical protein
MRSRDTTEATSSAREAARVARTRVLSGSVEHRVAQLENLLWVRAGEPLDPMPAAAWQLNKVRRLVRMRRYLAAVRA